MRPPAPGLRTPLVTVLLLALGCSEPVREDRTIGFSPDGRQVAFEHGQDGVYVADASGSKSVKVFQPDKDVVATSRPLASHTGTRLIFATARCVDGAPPEPLPIELTPPEGRIAIQVPVTYTCWLRDQPEVDAEPQVRRLFSSECDHVGYVSAGLVLRWHSDGQRILHIAKLVNSEGQHTVFEFDPATGLSRRVFPHAGQAVLCDWTPDGTQLVCVVGFNADAPDRGTAGVWIGRPGDDASWWHVPGSEDLPQGELPSLLESLRASRPAWTRDGSRFAFVSRRPGPLEGAVPELQIQLVDSVTRQSSTLAAGAALFSDLNWSPDGSTLGFLKRTGNAAELHLVQRDGTEAVAWKGGSIRKFAGFDASGTHVAVVTPERDEVSLENWNAGLLIPDPLSRDEVWLVESHDLSRAQKVFSGMRVTFPLWSPTEPRLSLWLTFNPRYRSLPSILMRWGLWPGDPAATLDVRTGAVSWLTVSPQEELQVGHYHLLRRDYSTAWTWYKKARAALPASKPPVDWREFTQRVGAPENSRLFEWLCLKKLNREDEALKVLAEFEKTFYPPVPPDQGGSDPIAVLFGSETEFARHMVHDLFAAEVFLSVDDPDAALEFFETEPNPTASDAVQLSRAIVRSQLLLITEQREAYLTHCTDVVAPLAQRLFLKDGASGSRLRWVPTLTGVALAPLFDSGFVESLPEGACFRCRSAWQSIRAKSPEGPAALAADLILREFALRFGDHAEAEALSQQIASSPDARIHEEILGSVISEVIRRSRLPAP